MLQAVRKGYGGTIEAHFLGGRPTSATVSVYTGASLTPKVSAGTAVLETVSTTLSAGVSAGATALPLTSGTGVVVGRRYLVGTTNGSEVTEAVTVKRVSGGTATIWAPLMHDHASGAAFAGTRASYAMSAGECDVLWTDGYADWTPNSGEIVNEVVECWLRPIPLRLIDEVDLRRVFADPQDVLPAGLDIPMALLEARDEFLRRLGAKNRAHAALGADHYRRPCALTFWIMREYELGPNYKTRVDDMKAELKALLADSWYQNAFDNNQDSLTTGATDGGYKTGGSDRK